MNTCILYIMNTYCIFLFIIYYISFFIIINSFFIIIINSFSFIYYYLYDFSRQMSSNFLHNCSCCGGGRNFKLIDFKSINRFTLFFIIISYLFYSEFYSENGFFPPTHNKFPQTFMLWWREKF